MSGFYTESEHDSGDRPDEMTVVDIPSGTFTPGGAIHLRRLETIKSRMNRIMAENTGRSIEEVTAACERDNFMSAEEALSFGLIDRVLEHH